MELGETPQETLVREIKEELDADITVGELVETVRLASAPSSPLFRFLQGGFLRCPAGLGGLWFYCLCIFGVFRFAFNDFDGGGAPGRLLHLPVKILAVGLPACFARLGVHAALSCLCAVDPVFFVCYECSAHCFCLPTGWFCFCLFGCQPRSFRIGMSCCRTCI